MKALVIVIPFLFFKRITHVYLLPNLLNLLINCKSARSAAQILSLKGECTFLFLHFLVIGLCNYSTNSRIRSETLATLAKSKGCSGLKYSHCQCHYQKLLIKIIYRPLTIWIFSNIKWHDKNIQSVNCFITQYFIGSCSSS